MDINELLYLGLLGDVGIIIIMGLITAAVQLLGIKGEFFWNRVWPATLILVLTSFAAGVVLWVGDYALRG